MPGRCAFGAVLQEQPQAVGPGLESLAAIIPGPIWQPLRNAQFHLGFVIRAHTARLSFEPSAPPAP